MNDLSTAFAKPEDEELFCPRKSTVGQTKGTYTYILLQVVQLYSCEDSRFTWASNADLPEYDRHRCLICDCHKEDASPIDLTKSKTSTFFSLVNNNNIIID